MLRIVLDVNVWVANFLAAARGRDNTCGRLLVKTVLAGQCRRGKADVLVVANVALPRGPVVATPFAAKAWLIDGQVPPAGVVLG